MFINICEVTFWKKYCFPKINAKQKKKAVDKSSAAVDKISIRGNQKRKRTRREKRARTEKWKKKKTREEKYKWEEKARGVKSIPGLIFVSQIQVVSQTSVFQTNGKSASLGRQ
jgi:hypothetical protein